MDLITPVGARTQWEVGGPAPAGASEVRAPEGVVEYEPADMTVTVGAGTPFGMLDALLAEHGQEVPLDPRSRDAHDRRHPRVRPFRHPAPAARTTARPRARSAVRDRLRRAREGWGTDGQERHRLRPAAVVRRITRHARRVEAGDVALPSSCPRRALVHRRRRACLPPAVGAVVGRRARTRVARRRSRRRGDASARLRAARGRTSASRRRAPGPHLGRARACAAMSDVH